MHAEGRKQAAAVQRQEGSSAHCCGGDLQTSGCRCAGLRKCHNIVAAPAIAAVLPSQ